MDSIKERIAHRVTIPAFADTKSSLWNKMCREWCVV